MKQLKIMIRAELDKRRLLRAKVTQVEKISVILNETAAKYVKYLSISLYINSFVSNSLLHELCLYRLNTNVNETLEMLEMMKANIDDRYKLNQIEAQVYQNIIEEYKETWQTYLVCRCNLLSILKFINNNKRNYITHLLLFLIGQI